MYVHVSIDSSILGYVQCQMRFKRKEIKKGYLWLNNSFIIQLYMNKRWLMNHSSQSLEAKSIKFRNKPSIPRLMSDFFSRNVSQPILLFDGLFF